MRYILIFIALSISAQAQFMPFAFWKSDAAPSPGRPPLAGDSLEARFRADTLFAKSTGDTLYHWEDATGNGHDLFELTDALKPTYSSEADSGKAAVVFDGLNDKLRDLTLDARNQPNTIIVVCRTYKPNDVGVVFDGVGAGRNLVFQNSVAWSAFAGSAISVGTPSIDTTYVITSRFNGTTASIRVNGIVTSGNDGSGGLIDITVGAGADDANTFNGRIHEVVFFDGLLTEAEVIANEIALADFWGVTLP